MNPTVFAMRRPVTTLMLVVALISGGALAYSRMRVDIFPSLNTPKIYVFLDYVGMSPDQMEGFIVNQLELYFQYVDGIQDINTRNIQQVALCELSFFPGTDMGQAMAQVVAMSDRAMSWMPKGTLPPMIMRMDAGSVPVGYLVFESQETSLGAMGDLAQNVIRPTVQKNVPGTVAISPFGPNMRSISVNFEFDESPTVVAAVQSVATEGLIGAVLTGMMILLFLRDWRSVIVVVSNIPLALLGSLFGLWVTGNTINIMSLGGMALAIGILVDEATVTIENTHVQMEATPNIATAVLRAGNETAVPRLLALLCILSVFIPAFIMEDPLRSLFMPLTLGVGFAMISSYVLSSTFVPIMCVRLLKHKGEGEEKRGLFDRIRDAYATGVRRLA